MRTDSGGRAVTVAAVSLDDYRAGFRFHTTLTVSITGARPVAAVPVLASFGGVDGPATAPLANPGDSRLHPGCGPRGRPYKPVSDSGAGGSEKFFEWKAADS